MVNRKPSSSPRALLDDLVTAAQSTQQRNQAAETCDASIAQLKRIAKIIACNQPALAPKLQF